MSAGVIAMSIDEVGGVAGSEDALNESIEAEGDREGIVDSEGTSHDAALGRTGRFLIVLGQGEPCSSCT